MGEEGRVRVERRCGCAAGPGPAVHQTADVAPGLEELEVDGVGVDARGDAAAELELEVDLDDVEEAEVAVVHHEDDVDAARLLVDPQVLRRRDTVSTNENRAIDGANRRCVAGPSNQAHTFESCVTLLAASTSSKSVGTKKT